MRDYSSGHTLLIKKLFQVHLKQTCFAFNCYFSDICDQINKNIMKYGYTDYDCDNCRVKILKLAYMAILDSNNKILIQTKFDNYFNVMYTSKRTKHYGELWRLKKIYN